MSAPNLGDYAENASVHFIWSTSDNNGASITRSTNGEIRVYKDNGVTQSTAGITDTEDFDGLTGVHACTIDLSADPFYAPGSNYSVVLQGAVIDGQTINTVLAQFSIRNRSFDGFRKNTAVSNFMFPMFDSQGNLKSGLTVTATRSIDGASFASSANSVSEIGTSGYYKINIAASDHNGNIIAWKFDGGATAEITSFTLPMQQ